MKTERKNACWKNLYPQAAPKAALRGGTIFPEQTFVVYINCCTTQNNEYHDMDNTLVYELNQVLGSLEVDWSGRSGADRRRAQNRLNQRARREHASSPDPAGFLTHIMQGSGCAQRDSSLPKLHPGKGERQ